MYAIAELSGKQFRIEPGAELKVPKQSGKIGDKVVLDKVLFFDNDKDKLIGTPFIKDMSIEAKISSHGRDKKIIVFKMKRRKRYRRKHGHRQEFSMIKFDKIDSKKKKTAAKKKTETKSTAKKVATKAKAATKKTTATKAKTTTKKTTTKAKAATKKKD
tara:strand:+ start:1210 stop:1686 length:477 start_codon:yes stop_codon:yes gene_type:complete